MYVKVYRTAAVAELELEDDDLAVGAANSTELPPDGEEEGPRALLREALRRARAGELDWDPPDEEFVALSWDDGNVLRTGTGGSPGGDFEPPRAPAREPEPRVPLKLSPKVSPARRGRRSKPGG